MYLKRDSQNITPTTLSPIRILLADSDADKIEQVLSNTEQQFQPSVRVCKSYTDLLPMLKEELPEVLLLGMFDTLNFFAICQKCHDTWEHLPIILLSRQISIDDQFRQVAIGKGAIDVVPNDLFHLNQLLHKFHRQLTTRSQADTTNTVQTVLTAMQEITEIGNKFFGPLAQGNYWRKTHANVLAEYSELHHWSANHFGVISCNNDILQSQLTEQDLQSLRKWVHLYISECERIIIDFGNILKNSNLSPFARQLLPDVVSSG
jgi:DNA-binding response OmpR family regulator